MRLSCEKSDRAYSQFEIYRYHVKLNGKIQPLGWYGADEERGEIYYYKKERKPGKRPLPVRDELGRLSRYIVYGRVEFVLKDSYDRRT